MGYLIIYWLVAGLFMSVLSIIFYNYGKGPRKEELEELLEDLEIRTGFSRENTLVLMFLLEFFTGGVTLLVLLINLVSRFFTGEDLI